MLFTGNVVLNIRPFSNSQDCRYVSVILFQWAIPAIAMYAGSCGANSICESNFGGLVMFRYRAIFSIFMLFILSDRWILKHVIIAYVLATPCVKFEDNQCCFSRENCVAVDVGVKHVRQNYKLGEWLLHMFRGELSDPFLFRKLDFLKIWPCM